MNANELMIGDWLLNEHTHDYFKVFPSMFSQITNFGETPNIDCEIFGIKPISLTPEILEKNGWKSYSRENTPIFGTIQGFEIVLAWMDYYWQLCVDGTVYRKIKIRYVHELQHALKLCSFEKTIEL